jgi:IS5 family transposase
LDTSKNLCAFGGSMIHSARDDARWIMARQAGLFDIEERLRELSAKGDDLERIKALVDYEAFRPELERAVPRSDRARGGRPPYDPVLMFRILILQASHLLSDERTEL